MGSKTGPSAEECWRTDMGPMCQKSQDIIHRQHKTTCRPIDSSTIETSCVTITVSAVVDVVRHLMHVSTADLTLLMLP